MLLKLPASLQHADWTKKAGALDKPYGLADDLKKFARLFDQLPQELTDLADLADEKAAQDIEQQLKGDYAKVAKSIADQARSIAATAKKCEAELKKDASAKAAAAAAGQIAADVTELSSDVNDTLTKALAALKGVKIKIAAEVRKEQEAAEKAKKAAEEKAAKGGGEAEEPNAAEDKARLASFNGRIKPFLTKLRTGALPELKFAFAQALKREEYKKGKVWKEKSLVLIGPRAGRSSMGELELKRGGEGFKPLFGRVFLATAEGKDKGKLIFEFESPIANIKQFKDAMMFQFGFCPKMKLCKEGGADAIDDEGEGEDTDDQGTAQADTDTRGEELARALQGRHRELKAGMDRLRAQGGALAAAMDKADEQFAALLKREQFGDAERLLGALREKVAAAGKPAGGAGGAGAQATDPRRDPTLQRLEAARSAWAKARGDAVKGIEELARAIEQEYRDEHDQRDQVAEATKKLRSLAGQLKDDLEKQLEQLVKTADAAARNNQIRAAKTRLTEVLRVVAADPLMKEIDGNELLPNLQIVKPMQERLREVAAALG